jgi:hypothetical protein
MIPLTEECTEQFRWWLLEDNVMMGVSILQFNPTVQIYTDATKKGWGEHVGDTLLQGLWSNEERTLHINNLEILAVTRTIDLSQDIVADRQVMLSTDNTSVVCYINNQGGTHSPSLCLLAWELLMKLHRLHREMKARHIPGCRHVLPDSLEVGKNHLDRMDSVDIKYLAYKTTFLLALASASRLSELHAIDGDSIQFGEDYRNVSYTPALGFLSNTQSPEDTQRALARITVMSLCETVDDRMSDDKKLCPIRALTLPGENAPTQGYEQL